MSAICENCEYFIQHYLKGQSGYTKIYFGHCIAFSKVKQRKPDAQACERFKKEMDK